MSGSVIQRCLVHDVTVGLLNGLANVCSGSIPVNLSKRPSFPIGTLLSSLERPVSAKSGHTKKDFDCHHRFDYLTAPWFIR